MAFVARTRSELKQMIVNLLESVGVSTLANGITETMLDGAVDILYGGEVAKEDMDMDTNPTLASSTKLEVIANTVGLQRELASAVTDLTFSNFNFYLSSNIKAKDITIDGTGFVLPAGIEITDSFGNTHVTLNDAIFRDESSAVFVPIAAVSPVSDDVPPNSLLDFAYDITLINNITSESLAGNDVFCSNARVIKGSAIDESDENLRFRLGLFGNSLNQSNEDRLVGVLTGIQGVTSVSLQKNRRGIGSVEVILTTDVTTPSDAIYARAEAVIKRWIYGSDNIYVVRPAFVPVAITIIPIFTEGEIQNLTEVQNAIAIAVTDYINVQIPQGGTLKPDDITDVARAAVTGVDSLSIGCMYINNRRVVPGKQTLRSDQKFIVLNPLDIKVG